MCVDTSVFEYILIEFVVFDVCLFYVVCLYVCALHMLCYIVSLIIDIYCVCCISEVGGRKASASPIGKSLRFVRACGWAGGRASSAYEGESRLSGDCLQVTVFR